jgi:hypothetical protein
MTTTAIALMTALPQAHAQDDDALIREHILKQFSISSEEVQKSALTDLLTAPVYEVSIKRQGMGTSTTYMAVQDGEVFRLPRYDLPQSKEGFIRLLPADFRVNSTETAKRLVAAAMALHSSFGEPEMTPDEMRIVEQDGDFFLVDGERFDKATGYHIAVDGDGKVTSFEYSNELPVENSEEES